VPSARFAPVAFLGVVPLARFAHRRFSEFGWIPNIGANMTGMITVNITENMTADITANIRALISENIVRIIVAIIVRIVTCIVISIIATVLITIIVRIITTDIEARIETNITAIMTTNIERIIAEVGGPDSIPPTAPLQKAVSCSQRETKAVSRFFAFSIRRPLRKR
jgi:hypothetical protein